MDTNVPGVTATPVPDLFNDFATDASAEAEGVWEPYTDKVSFLIARSHNPGYDRMILAETRKHKTTLQAKTEAAKTKGDEIMVDVMAHHILKGWKGEFNFQGQPMGEYSVAKARKLLAVKDFRVWVSAIADDHERFKAVKDEEDAKN